MKKILLITDSSFISKNFQDYIKVNNIKEKLIVRSPYSISKSFFKIKMYYIILLTVHLFYVYLFVLGNPTPGLDISILPI